MKRIFATIAAACLLIAAASIAQMIKPGGGSGGGGTTYTATSPIDITGTVVSCPTCSVTAPGLVGPLETCTASAAASCDFTDTISATHHTYWVVLQDIVPSVDGGKIGLRFSTDGGSTWDATVDIYGWGAHYGGGPAVSGSNGDDTDTASYFTPDQQSDSPLSFNGDFYINNPASASLHKYMRGLFTGHFAGPTFGAWTYSGRYKSTTAVTDFQIIPSSGTFTGVIRTYGIAK